MTVGELFKLHQASVEGKKVVRKTYHYESGHTDSTDWEEEEVVDFDSLDLKELDGVDERDDHGCGHYSHVFYSVVD